MIKYRLHGPKPTHLQETYETIKDAAYRHGKKFTLSFDEWLPIWARLEESYQRKKNIKLSGIIND